MIKHGVVFLLVEGFAFNLLKNKEKKYPKSVKHNRVTRGMPVLSPTCPRAEPATCALLLPFLFIDERSLYLSGLLGQLNE